MDRFYMLYVEDGGKPNQVYLAFEGAMARARVLARETRKRVFILESKLVVTADVPEVNVTYNVQGVD